MQRAPKILQFSTGCATLDPKSSAVELIFVRLVVPDSSSCASISCKELTMSRLIVLSFVFMMAVVRLEGFHVFPRSRSMKISGLMRKSYSTGSPTRGRKTVLLGSPDSDDGGSEGRDNGGKGVGEKVIDFFRSDEGKEEVSV